MENATHALRIAAGVIISLLIVSLIIFGYNKISAYKKQQSDLISIEQVEEFNKKFESYNRSNLRGYDVISLVTYATDLNDRFSEEEGFEKVKIYITLNTKEIEKLEKESGTAPKYSIKILNNLENTKPNKITLNNIEYIEFNDYLTDKEYGFESESKNTKNNFKKAFFECVRMEYDNSHGRFKSMYLSQIFTENLN